MLGKEVNLEEALGFPDSTLRHNPKHHFRNYLTDISKACESILPNE